MQAMPCDRILSTFFYFPNKRGTSSRKRNAAGGRRRRMSSGEFPEKDGGGGAFTPEVVRSDSSETNQKQTLKLADLVSKFDLGEELERLSFLEYPPGTAVPPGAGAGAAPGEQTQTINSENENEQNEQQHAQLPHPADSLPAHRQSMPLVHWPGSSV